MIVIKAGNRIIINPVEICIALAKDNRYNIDVMASNAYADTLDVWPLNGKGTSQKAAEEMLEAISEAIARHIKSPLPHIHVDIEQVERILREKKEESSKGSTLSPLTMPEGWKGMA